MSYKETFEAHFNELYQPQEGSRFWSNEEINNGDDSASSDSPKVEWDTNMHDDEGNDASYEEGVDISVKYDYANEDSDNWITQNDEDGGWHYEWDDATEEVVSRKRKRDPEDQDLKDTKKRKIDAMDTTLEEDDDVIFKDADEEPKTEEDNTIYIEKITVHPQGTIKKQEGGFTYFQQQPGTGWVQQPLNQAQYIPVKKEVVPPATRVADLHVKPEDKNRVININKK